jgi:hypothetical protein
MEQVFYIFAKGGLKVDTHVPQRTSTNVSSFCNDHHLGSKVCAQDSRRTYNPKVVLTSPGICHVDGLYPGDTSTPPLFMLRSCRVSSG